MSHTNRRLIVNILDHCLRENWIRAALHNKEWIGINDPALNLLHTYGTSHMKRNYCAALLWAPYALILLSLHGCIDNNDDDAPQKMNIVFILSDDQRFDTLWAMPKVQKHLTNHGVLFENAVVTTPLCCPARASIISGGLYDKNTGVYRNDPPSGGFVSFDDRRNLGTALQQSGYRTGLIGKVMNWYHGGRTESVNGLPAGYVLPGWNTLVANDSPAQDDWYNFKVTVGSSGLESAVGDIVGPITQYVTDFHKDKALEFIGDSANTPFFLLLSSYAPHTPAIPAKQDEDLFQDYIYSGRGVTEHDLSDKPIWVRDSSISPEDKSPPQADFPAKQLRSLQALDRTVEAIIEKLIELDKIDNTMIIYTSDNGFMWGEHGIWKKRHEYEESVRVPLVIRYPGGTPRTESTLVAMDLDIPATILELANSDFRSDGLSLIPLLEEKTTIHRDKIFVNMYENYDRFKTWSSIRTSEWKYIENASGEKQLYYLMNDPFELESKHEDPVYAAVMESLKRELD